MDERATEGLIELLMELAPLPGAWARDALCLEYPDLDWFAEGGKAGAEAKAVCGRCLCQQECRSYAIANGVRDGIWAGESASDLRRSAAA